MTVVRAIGEMTEIKSILAGRYLRSLSGWYLFMRQSTAAIITAAAPMKGEDAA